MSPNPNIANAGMLANPATSTIAVIRLFILLESPFCRLHGALSESRDALDSSSPLRASGNSSKHRLNLANACSDRAPQAEVPSPALDYPKNRTRSRARARSGRLERDHAFSGPPGLGVSCQRVGTAAGSGP